MVDEINRQGLLPLRRSSISRRQTLSASSLADIIVDDGVTDPGTAASPGPVRI